MRFNWKIFFAAFVFSLATELFSNALPFLPILSRLTPEQISWIGLILAPIGFAVNPVLLFATFFLMGRKIDLVTELQSVIVPLFLGCWLGNLLGFFSVQLAIYTRAAITSAGQWGLLSILWYLWYVFASAFSPELFTSFAALSLAYITSKRSQ